MIPFSLVNKKIKIEISDPWEFEDEVGRAEFKGEIKQIFRAQTISEAGEHIREVLLIKLEHPFGYKKMKCEYIFASPRHENEGIEELMKEPISSNFTRIPTIQGQSENPFDTHQWHESKGFDLMGTLEL